MVSTENQESPSLEEIARNALADSAGVPPGRVPTALVRAVVSGIGNREEIAAAARALGSGAGCDLVRFDTDRIASFVFESSRPPVLAGASKILRDLNAGIARDYVAWTLFSAGGEGLLLTPRGRGKQLCQKIEKRYQRDSIGALSVTTAFVSVGPEDFVPGGNVEANPSGRVRVVSGTPAVLSRLHDAIRRKKDEQALDRESVPGDRPRCRSCRDRIEGTKTLKSLGRLDEDGALCGPCAERWEKGKELIKGISFEDLIERWTGARPEGSRKDGYLGFLYADGNGMGALFGGLTSLGELQMLSREVTGCFKALRDRVLAAVAKVLKPTGTETPATLYLDLLAGGDEVIWILPAGLAVHVAEQLPAWLDAEVAKRPALVELLARQGRPGLTVGIGLALCGLGYPVRYQYQLAKALQKEAKQRSGSTGKEESTIDFELLTDSSPQSQDFKSLRRLMARTEEDGFLRTCRPYSSEEMTQLRQRVERALDSELALSQLYGLAAGSHQGRRPFLNLLRYQIARKPAADRYQAWLKSCGVDAASPEQIESFFVRDQGETAALWIDDALDLLPFFDSVNNRLKERSA